MPKSVALLTVLMQSFAIATKPTVLILMAAVALAELPSVSAGNVTELGTDCAAWTQSFTMATKRAVCATVRTVFRFW